MRKVKTPMSMRGRPPILLFTALLAACAAPLVRPAPFRAQPDSVDGGDLRGPFDGRVIDAETDRPVAGAQVYATWSFVAGYGLTAPAGWHEHLTVTDAGGRYVVPKLKKLPRGVGGARLAAFHLVVYKRGYVAYRSDRRFDDFGPRTDFTQKRHEVRLERWRSDISHVKHLRYVGGGETMAELTKWEVPEAAAELAGRPSPGEPTVVGPTGPDEPERPALDAAPLLTPDDVAAATGHKGAFDVGDLGDEPASPEYDSVHLRARDLDETYDVAARVWRLPLDEAPKHFKRLLDELPNVKQTNELGDASLRAVSPQGDILGAAYLDAKRGFVVLVQCGASTCTSGDAAVKVLEKVKAHIDAAFPVGGQP